MRNAISGRVQLNTEKKDHLISVALLSHGYNIYDDHVSMRVFDKLEKLGVRVHSPENLTMEQRTNGMGVLETNLYWANEYEMTGAGGHYLLDNKVDGLITITSFGCGPDSLMIERLTRFAKRHKKPLLNLTIDEHTGEAGFITRLEAFTDMLFRRKRAHLVETLNKQISIDDTDTREKQVIGA